MTKYCSQCGEKIVDEDTSFCPKCGTPLNSKTTPQKDYKLPILGLITVVIILIIGIGFVTGGFGLFGEQTSISIISESPISNSANFTIKLTANNQEISGKPVEITFKNNENTYTFNQTTDLKGLASIVPNVEAGDYEVTCSFAGDKDYAKSTTTSKTTVESKATEINSQVTSTRTEPDYQSFYYAHSFEDTDKDGDGYVYLSDMNIAHTPQNIVKKMFEDSDSDGDGRLNHDEYYKFMYKLNYDISSYGLDSTI